GGGLHGLHVAGLLHAGHAVQREAVLWLRRGQRSAARGHHGPRGGVGMDALAKPPAEYRAYRIEAGATNRLVVVFDPLAEDVSFIHCVEIWDEGGAQPPNVHANADEIFYILKGEAVAHCDGRSFPLAAGDSFLA